MRQPSVRGRVTLVAAAAVALVLVVAGAVVLVTVERQLIGDIDDLAATTADALAPSIEGGATPDELVVRGDDDTFAQLVDEDGSVVAATANVAAAGSVVESTRPGTRTLRGMPHDPARFRVLVRPAAGRTLVVGVPLDDTDESINALRRTLLVVSPVVLLALAGVVWVVVGRTLRPVEEANRRQRQFVADASHELRSPLTRIRTELEVDLAHPGRAQHAETHRSVLADAIGLQSLVDDLLQLARSDAGAAATPRGPVDLDDLVLVEVQRVRPQARVTIDVSAVSGAQVVGDAAQLGRVVRNLLDNAVRHGRRRVEVDVHENPDAAILAVTDDGPGIPEDERERVFERFTRVDGARSTRAGGTGLGLAITRDIVEAHGGTVSIDVTHRPGTRMVVRIPRPH